MAFLYSVNVFALPFTRPEEWTWPTSSMRVGRCCNARHQSTKAPSWENAPLPSMARNDCASSLPKIKATPGSTISINMAGLTPYAGSSTSVFPPSRAALPTPPFRHRQTTSSLSRHKKNTRQDAVLSGVFDTGGQLNQPLPAGIRAAISRNSPRHCWRLIRSRWRRWQTSRPFQR